MQQIAYLLPALICPVGMGAMMWFMMRGKKEQPIDPAAQQQELHRLRMEVAALRTEQPATAQQWQQPQSGSGR